MNRCVIITAYIEGRLDEILSIRSEDFIICADGGYAKAMASNIQPNVLIGDFDSLQLAASPTCPVVTVPAEKDDTDTMLCVKHGIALGYRSMFIVGGLGGRLDHTLANLQAISYCIDHGATAWIADGNNRATMLDGGSLTLKNNAADFFSLLSYSAQCDGVSIRGAKYELSEATLTQSFPLGISNAFLDKDVEISVGSGKLLIVLANEAATL